MAIQLTGWFLRRKPNRKWTYTSEAMVREEAGFLTVDDYIRRRQNTATQYIAM